MLSGTAHPSLPLPGCYLGTLRTCGQAEKQRHSAVGEWPSRSGSVYIPYSAFLPMHSGPVWDLRVYSKNEILEILWSTYLLYI